MTQTKEYSNKTMRRFLKPKNFGELKNPDAVGEVGNPTCGDIMHLYIKVDPKTKKIKKIKFKTYGCAAAIASTEQLTKIAKGKTIAEAEKLTMKDVADSLKGLPQIKLHCSSMAVQALKKAIKGYREGK
ncbi:MAG: iron-sulfur cluster assembly scaffold protein [Nanoarchaeota archaeon]|nr:iron-sulfur cluster assembly scaffold protein [Nanoarchaeota archaeon]